MQSTEWFVEQLDTCLPRVTTQMIRFIRDCPTDVTLPQAFLLQQIRLHGSCTATTIGEIMGTTSGPVTSLTKRLMSRGLIERRQDESDRRVVWFALTDEGNKVLDAIVENRRQKWRKLVELLGQEKASALLSIVMDIEEQLTNLR